jgi:phosphoribosylformimino-5-aminoimidazole carboxamide ribotide isomerase
MTILPVLDLLDGLVVRGVAGRRAEYRPLRSRLVETSVPLDVARALRTGFGFQQLYVADLDGILHRRPNWDACRQLIDDGFRLLVDAGVRDVDEGRRMNELGIEVVIGLESTPTPEQVARLAAACDAVTFSLDLQNGVPLLPEEAIGWSRQPREIVRQVIGCGISRLIVLDLADVGMGSGTRTGSLCSSILFDFPGLHLTCGGGIRGVEDLRYWQALGAGQVLVASALHDGRLSASDLTGFSAMERAEKTSSLKNQTPNEPQ